MPVSWGGPTPSNITGATIAINGTTIDLLAFNNLWQAEWLDFNGPFIQIATTVQNDPFPPWSPILPSSQYNLSTPNGGKGVFYLQDSNHQFSTNAFLTVTRMASSLETPAPVVGIGLPAVALITAVLVYKLLRLQRHQPPRYFAHALNT
jgi:hypothetical protein